MTIEQLYTLYLRSRMVVTDSRKITPGCLFFAFKGETFDGNSFVPQAIAQGAALCVTTDKQHQGRPECMVVDDALQTLQQLAAYHRSRLTIPVVGVTGTNGKTTTKELVHAVLSRRYRTHATAGNYNNHLGVPLTLLSIPADAEMAIVEMGANHPGEIEALCRIADPDAGLITNVGRAHLEGFGSFEGVVRTKTELYRYLAAKRGLAFVNADNERLMHESAQLARITYGTAQGADVRGTLVADGTPTTHFYFEVGDNVYNVRTHLLGNYNFDNGMAAVAVGLHYGVEPFDIKEAIEHYEPSNRRSQYKATERNRLFLDCYNANPSSMNAAVESFAALPYPNKIPMLGGMKELGQESEQEHRAIVSRLLQGDYAMIVLVGPEFAFAKDMAPRVQWFEDVHAAADHFHRHPIQDATLLLKGSNSTRMWLLEPEL